ncbi:fef2e5aa-ec31-4d9a-8383-4bed8bb878c8 [Sclerotinia trifoliorum]|uniref:Fef2e5aa-ec31-4d9a-8383-4bed8bb878c8 n=1 Tax=Sclerotinia trifoliorum TaxID=28548 RepID=A0A8H2VXE5_9HELO|nr:fef2e5aa-ec31-4d9a-8383-4bed8bb878c8 [Sclerotinia trifoliorum]
MAEIKIGPNMSSATLNGVGSVTTSSKIINLASDDEDSENGDVLQGVSRDTSRGMPHHQNAVPQELEEALSANESSAEDGSEGFAAEGGGDGEEEDDEESFCEDLIDGLTDEGLLDNQSDSENCTREEAQNYRRDLRRLGPREFCRVTVESNTITAKKLLTAFAIRPPSYLDGQPDEEYYQLLSYALRRELMKRLKLPDFNTVQDATNLIKNANKIIVITGAGISTSLGIPDFRSANGLYAKLGYLGLSDPQEVFNIDIFKRDPTIFFQIAKDILPSVLRFSPTHQFIKVLQDKGKLLTNYTQNIDGIESAAGILPEKIIQCHGSFATATCQQCDNQVKGTEVFPDIKAGNIPRCKVKGCKIPPPANQTLKRKRSSNGGNKKRGRSNNDDENEADDIPQPGIMKPDITFFGEQLPDKFSDRLSKHDRDQVDLVITIGTSLKVAPVSEVVPYLPSNVPQIQINRDPVSHVEFDIDLLGECDVVVSELCKALGWSLDHEMIPQNQEIEVTTVPGFSNRHQFKQTHPVPARVPVSVPEIETE